MNYNNLVFTALLVVNGGCAVSPEKCNPLIPDIGIGTALGCWVSGNTEANLENMRTEISNLAERVELQQLAVREISISSELMSKDIDQYENYLSNTQIELDNLDSRISESEAQNEKQRVAREALKLEVQDLKQEIVQAKANTQPTLAEIEELQIDISKKRSAIETMNQVLLE